MDVVTLPQVPEPRSAEIIDLAAWRRARAEARGEVARDPSLDPYPWAYTFPPREPLP